jgi:hypothetical protein
LVEVSLLLGTAAAAAWLFVDILFLRRFIGVPLSEHLGMILGNLGLALACRAARTGNGGNWVLAMFSISLALCARPGAMLTIPALVVGAFVASPRGQPRRWVLPVALVLAALAAALVNSLLSRAVGKPESVSVSYAVYILHSIVLGGTWKDALNRYGDNRAAAWHVVTGQIMAHPLSLLSGIARSLSAVVLRGYLFSFVVYRWLNVLLHLAFATGVVAVLVKLRSDRRTWWLFAFLAGLAASMPFLPPWDTDNMRAYAASIPLIAFTVAVGVHAGLAMYGASRFAQSRRQAAFPANPPAPSAYREPRGLGNLVTVLLAAVLVLCALIPPLLRKPDRPLPADLEDIYYAGRSEGTISYSPRIALRLFSGDAPSGGPALELARFKAGLVGLARLFPGESTLLSTLPSGCALLPGFHEFSFIAIDASHLPAGSGESDIGVRFKFLADDTMVLAVDDALLARSAALAAYDSPPLGQFSFGLNRFPVLRTDDTATLRENVVSTELLHDAGNRPNVNPNQPLVLGSKRINFPLAGEYHLLVNHRYPLKVLVLPRDSTRADSERMVTGFVEANCVLVPDAESNLPGVQSRPDLARFFESDSPPRLTRGSMLELVALLESGAACSHSR